MNRSRFIPQAYVSRSIRKALLFFKKEIQQMVISLEEKNTIF